MMMMYTDNEHRYVTSFKVLTFEGELFSSKSFRIFQNRFNEETSNYITYFSNQQT